VPLAEEATGRTGTNFFARLLRDGVDPFVMADRAGWGQATRRQRQLAVASDAELRCPPPGQPWPPLRSAKPSPVTHARPGDKTLTAATGIEEIGRQTTDLATADFPSPIKVAATAIRWPGSAELFRWSLPRPVSSARV